MITKNPNLEMDIYKYRLYINLMFNLLNDEFNIEFSKYLKDNEYLANDFDISNFWFTPEHEILTITIKNHNLESTKQRYDDIVNILQNSMTEELFALIKKSKHLDSLLTSDKPTSRILSEVTSHIVHSLSDRNLDFSNDYSYEELTFEEYNKVINSIQFDKYLFIEFIKED